MPDYELYRLKVSALTPLHIGSGAVLLNEYDYAVHQGRTWRINDAALLDAQNVDDPAFADQLARTPPSHLLRNPDYIPESAYFHYVIQGVPRSSVEGAQLREQLKDPFDHAYLPGTSLKGSLRTALAWYGWEQIGLKPELGKLGQMREWASQAYEHEIFGRDPNHDLLRALQISDSQALPAGECLMILNVRVVNRSGALGSPIEVEAIRPDVTFELDLKLDHALFTDWARKSGLRLRGEEWLANLGLVVQAHTHQRIQDEIRWYQAVPGTDRIRNYYRQLEKSKLDKTRFLIQIGWGTGWGDKTLGSRLASEPDFLETIIRKFRLGRGRRQPGDPFPKSRRVAMAISRSPQGQARETPAYPLGWALVEMEPAT